MKTTQRFVKDTSFAKYFSFNGFRSTELALTKSISSYLFYWFSLFNIRTKMYLIKISLTLYWFSCSEYDVSRTLSWKCQKILNEANHITQKNSLLPHWHDIINHSNDHLHKRKRLYGIINIALGTTKSFWVKY